MKLIATALPALVLSVGLAGLDPAVAQGTSIGGGGIPPVSVGGGSPRDPGAADTTGSTTSTGQTKPPGAPVGERAGTRADLERKNEEIDRKVKDGICKGC